MVSYKIIVKVEVLDITKSIPKKLTNDETFELTSDNITTETVSVDTLVDSIKEKVQHDGLHELQNVEFEENTYLLGRTLHDKKQEVSNLSKLSTNQELHQYIETHSRQVAPLYEYHDLACVKMTKAPGGSSRHPMLDLTQLKAACKERSIEFDDDIDVADLKLLLLPWHNRKSFSPETIFEIYVIVQQKKLAKKNTPVTKEISVELLRPMVYSNATGTTECSMETQEDAIHAISSSLKVFAGITLLAFREKVISLYKEYYPARTCYVIDLEEYVLRST
jgi:hypothetical protein